MTNAPTLLGMPTEVRLTILDMLISTSTRKDYQNVGMVNHLLKNELDAEVYRILKKELNALLKNAPAFAPIRLDFDMPEQPQTTYNLVFTLAFNPGDYEEALNKVEVFENVLKPLLALNVESATILLRNLDTEGIKNKAFFFADTLLAELESQLGSDQGQQGDLVVRPNRIGLEMPIELWGVSFAYNAYYTIHGREAEKRWTVKFDKFDQDTKMARETWIRKWQYRK